ncbi:GMC oxidoreductase [Streptomyces sp. OE57]|uniref:GMC oxidoreductase n=1 Tax=Streptomyces lacaronensis TaxID=3379885 RepID=UPI0039B757D1
MSDIQILAEAASSQLSADVVVIGTGAGGSAAAGALRRQGADILMIEAGNAHSQHAGRHLRNDLPDDDFYSKAFGMLAPHAGSGEPMRGLPGVGGIHAVGGMMIAWSHAVPRPHVDVEWDGTFPKDELERHLADAEALLGATDDLYGSGNPRQQWVAQRIAERLVEAPRSTPLAAKRTAGGTVEWSGSDALLSAGDDAGKVTILSGFVARKVRHRDARGLAVEAYDGRGSIVTVTADAFVIGGGAFGGPQLLHASGLRHPALGRYLTDHLNVVLTVPLEDGVPPATADSPIALHLPVSRSRPFHTGILDLPSVAHQGWLVGGDPRRATTLGAFVGTEPVAHNRLLFHDSRTDAFGLPAVDAEVHLTEGDHARAVQALAFEYEVARTIGDPWRNTTALLRPPGSSLHVMGTHRLGSDENTSVADMYGRLRGSDNIYLVGNGVLGSRNSCNPTLTTVALALRAAEHLSDRGRFRGRTVPGAEPVTAR